MEKTIRKSSMAQHRRSNVSGVSGGSLKQTLLEIRAKRLSSVAPAKGLFPRRTPSVSISATPQKEEEAPTERLPILSLTKLDFELLREWDWKKRQKRLETWTEGSGLGNAIRKSHALHQDLESKPEPSSFSDAVRAKTEREAKAKAHERTGEILKRELEELTGKRVQPLLSEGQKARQKAKPQEIIKPDRKPFRTNSIVSEQSKGSQVSRRSSYRARHQEQLEKVDKELDKVMDKARAIELKATFGKGWGRAGRKSQNARKSVAASEKTRRSMQASSVKSESVDSRQHRQHRSPGQPKAIKTDEEERQPPTSYASQTSRGHTTTADDEVASQTGSIGVPALLKSMHELYNADEDADSSDEKETLTPKGKKEKEGAKFGKKAAPIEYQDTSFGGIKLISRTSKSRGSKDKKGREYYMSFDDTELGLGMGKTQHLRIRFFKEDGPGYGRSENVLARERLERLKREKAAEAKRAAEAEKEAAELEHETGAKRRTTIKTFAELPQMLDLDDGDKDKYAARLAQLEKALMQIPGIGSGYRIEVEQLTRKPSMEIPANSRVSRRQQYTRPPRRVWYTPLPLAIKKYYRTNWKRIRFDVRQEMRNQNFFPKLWINFEETHPKKLFELIHYKLAVNSFGSVGLKKIFDWEKGIHPDYVDWILEDIIPHPGQYYYDEERDDPVRRASLEENDLGLKDWFMKPPRYVPPSPMSPPFDQFDFCGYGNREHSYFLDFTLPREIRHYYHPPSNIELFFQEIPKPPYAFPGYTFKRWLKYPLDQKLPQYYPFPKRFAIWTRGKIGDTINCNSTVFKLDDPLIYKRDWTYSPYHDVHTRKYFLKKSVLDRIWELGLINSKGEVKCTMKEFNQHRAYLRDYEWLEECLRRWTDKWVSRLEHNHLTKEANIDILDWAGKKREHQKKIDRCKASRKVMEKIKEKHWIRIREKYEKSVRRAVDIKNELQVEMIIRARQRKKEQRLRNKIHRGLQQGRILFLQRIYADRHKRANRHRKRYHVEKIVEKVERQRDTYIRHVEFNRRKMEEMKEIQEKLEREHMDRIQKRKQSSQKAWKMIPLAILHKKERLRKKAERIRNLVSKYFHIWRDKTVHFIALRAHAISESTWDPRTVLVKQVRRLEAASGRVKVEDQVFALVLNKGMDKRLSEQSKSRKSGEGERRKRRTSGSLHFAVEKDMNNYIPDAYHHQSFEISGDDDDDDDDDGEEKVEGVGELLHERIDTTGYDGDLEDDDD